MTLLWVLTLVFVLQVPVALVVWYDAHRRRLERSFIYSYAIMIPVIGYMFVPVYLSRRGEEPRHDPPDVS